MAKVLESKKACAVNPLKMSAPLGASFAFMGLDACMPVMHGSQGCTSFGLVLLVRHFKEAIPLQTTAMNEVTTVLGGYENIEQALLNIRTRAKPKIIAICSTGLTETKGDDVQGYLELARQRRPELEDTALVYVSTPDYVGAFEDGYRLAVKGLIQALVRPRERVDGQVNLLPGSHLTPADIEELREIIESFGLDVVVLPDVSGSLDGHIPEDWRGTTLGGASLADFEAAGGSVLTIAVGEQMRDGAKALESVAGVPYQVFDRLTGVACNDQLMTLLSELSGRPVPKKWRRQRSQLMDAMLDGHFYFGDTRVAIAAEPDLLFAAGSLLVEMGAKLQTCITSTHSPILERLPVETVVVGDLEDWESSAAKGCDLLVSHAHGRQGAERLGLPFFRLGFPIFDRIGNQHRVMVGYRGTADLIFDIANLLIEHLPHGGPDTWPIGAASVQAAQSLGTEPPLGHSPESQSGCAAGACGCAESSIADQPSTEGVAP